MAFMWLSMSTLRLAIASGPLRSSAGSDERLDGRAGSPDESPQSAACHFVMIGNGESCGVPRANQDDMTTALSDDLPPESDSLTKVSATCRPLRTGRVGIRLQFRHQPGES